MNQNDIDYIGRILIKAVLGTEDGGILYQGNLPVEEIARLLVEEAPQALINAGVIDQSVDQTEEYYCEQCFDYH